MTAKVELALRTILSQDPEVSLAAMDRAMDVLNGLGEDPRPDELPKYISFELVAEHLHADRRKVDAYVRKGLLDLVVRGDGHVMGISRESFERFEEPAS